MQKNPVKSRDAEAMTKEQFLLTQERAEEAIGNINIIIGRSFSE